mmetsp:Transcript_48624/g.66064  ORF Transcript_48624/g.66064 Transcript_48624/m.66064 type:complete len:278 (-) Transcript_48624:190-1023(-)
MITVLPEAEGEEGNTDQVHNDQFVSSQQAAPEFVPLNRCRGGRGGRGRGGFHGGRDEAWHGGKKAPFRQFISNFLTEMGVEVDFNDIESKFKNWKNENKGEEGGPCNWGQNWNLKRAKIITKPEEVLEATEGQVIFANIEVMNGTHWPWKSGCFLGMSDDGDLVGLPIEPVSVTVDQNVQGQSNFKLAIPLKVVSQNVDYQKVYEIKLAFRGPGGRKFGEEIVLKLKVKKLINETEFFSVALKLHEAGLGSFDDCVAALKEANSDEAAAVKLLQRKQ